MTEPAVQHQPLCVQRASHLVSRLAFWFGLALLWASSGWAAGDASVAIGQAGQYPLTQACAVLEDPGGKLELPEVLARVAQGHFTSPAAQPRADNNFGMSRSAYWLFVRLSAAKEAPTRWLLELAYPPLDQVDVYQSTPTGAFEHMSGGDLRPFTSRAVPHRNHVMPVTLQPGGETLLLLRVASEGTVAVPLRLWQPAALSQHDQADYSVLSLYFGLLGGLLLYNLLLFFAVADRAYLIYVCFVAWLAVTEAALTGLGTQFIWPQWTRWNSVAPVIGMALSSGFAIAFARSFLSSQHRMPRVDRIMRALILFCGMTALAGIFLPYTLASRMVTALAAVAVMTLVTAGVVSVRDRHPGARYFLTAWMVLLIGVGVLGLHNNGFVPSNIFTANALLIGSALEMVLLSFALADRINQARAEKELAQANGLAEHQMAQALRQSQQQLQASVSEREAILNNALVGIVLSVARRHEWVNEKFASMMGFDRSELIGRSSRYIYADDETYAQFGKDARAELVARGTCVCERQLRRRNGDLFWVVMAGSCLRSHDPDSGVIWTFLDITERKQAEEETAQALIQQKELNELRSRFVAMTSHEFRTPLAAILSSQELLTLYGERLQADEKDLMLDTIASSVHRMTRMLDRILLLGKVEANMLEFRPQEIDLKALCEELITQARTQHADSRCTVVLEFAAQCAVGTFDEKLLRHIFTNLLSNAIKYSPDGGEVCMRVQTQGSQTVFEVSDQGIGIPQDELGHLFAAFQRASNVGSIAGTGLGLAIVKQSTDLHGGHITVRSQTHQGTTFTVTL